MAESSIAAISLHGIRLHRSLFPDHCAVDAMNLERLSQPLDKIRVKQREGGSGVKLSYLETHDVIRAANDIFGYGGWGHRITELRLIKEVTVHNTKYDPPKAGVCVGYLCLVELSVYVVEGNGVTSGVGYGDATEYRESAAVTAHELAAKEAESDALKRALKNYGDQFGLALYSKTAASDGHLSTGRASSTTTAEPSPSPASQNTITDAQGKRLWAIAQENDVDAERLKLLVKEIAGVNSSRDVPKALYEQLVEAVQGESVPFS
jgi:DNA repair and recombination protein RAD52